MISLPELGWAWRRNLRNFRRSKKRRRKDIITMTYKQALRVAARESKGSAVRWSTNWKNCSRQTPLPIDPPNITRSSTPGCRVGRTEMQLEQQLVAAAPKVDFADRDQWPMESWSGTLQRSLDLSKRPFLMVAPEWHSHGFWSAQNVPRQQNINAGYFTVKEVVLVMKMATRYGWRPN